jgi:2-polyprenyl-6-hydroxyphenyl methylase / 3-demethylubiquinone-9 3-methyltransferase
MATSFSTQVNNDLYHELGERWYHAKDDPVALLRAESRARNPWIMAEIQKAFPAANVLDIGCGAGLLANDMAQRGMTVTGLDASPESLEVARRHDLTGRVDYQVGDANDLPFAPESFDVVCAMDFLEHVEDPAHIVAEAARVLKPNGLFFFHTFNRNFIAWLIGIKGVEWFVKNTPRHMHILRYFIKPAELAAMCERNRMQVLTMRGLAPVIFQRAFWKMIVTGIVDDDFRFEFTRGKLLGYAGIARKSQ